MLQLPLEENEKWDIQSIKQSLGLKRNGWRWEEKIWVKDERPLWKSKGTSLFQGQWYAQRKVRFLCGGKDQSVLHRHQRGNWKWLIQTLEADRDRQ